ncbi:MAG: hypothetical protein PHW28_10025 [Mesotoga sp.]|nr:hypothetical protein [Mesotoga sp.]
MPRHTHVAERSRVFQLEILEAPTEAKSPALVGWVNGIRVNEDNECGRKRRTLVKDCVSEKQAKRWAGRYGTVISCRKVGASPDRSVSRRAYNQNIEHLNLKQEIEIPLERTPMVTVNERNEVVTVHRKQRKIIIDR